MCVYSYENIYICRNYPPFHCLVIVYVFMKPIVFWSFLIWGFSLWPQSGKIKGTFTGAVSGKPISEVNIVLEESDVQATTDGNGHFVIENLTPGWYTLKSHHIAYSDRSFKVHVVEGSVLELGIITMEESWPVDQISNVISLSENDLETDTSADFTPSLLAAVRDVFVNRAAFDFGQAFFRIRGYDARARKVVINGVPMNKLFNGKADWNNWGGLNDVMKNQEYIHGLAANSDTFGAPGGTTTISTRASQYRRGLRLSFSRSNRSYYSRIMATYNGGIKKQFRYSVSASRRWAKEGYTDGTLYDAYALFASGEYRINNKYSLNCTGMLSSVRRGRSAPVTEEVYKLMGSTYNPYWGIQGGRKRSSRIRTIREPIFLLNMYRHTDTFSYNLGAAYQFGAVTNSRIGYYNAPNPLPDYYRYLPSFYINGRPSANFESANQDREAFTANPQLPWKQLYGVNANPELGGKAAYLLYNDVVKDKQWIIHAHGNLTLSNVWSVDFNGFWRKLNSDNYAQIQDLLGADFHTDTDPFTKTRNDITGKDTKGQNDLFAYHYNLYGNEANAFVQLHWKKGKWQAFTSAVYTGLNYQREGRFQNERFKDNSMGKGERINFNLTGLKCGLRFQLNGKHWLEIHALKMQRAPLLKNSFINPRESNEIVPNLTHETVWGWEGNYFIRLPEIKGRLTGYYTTVKNTTDVNFFYTDSGHGSGFAREIVSGLNKKYKGIELGLEYQVSPDVKLSWVSAVGSYIYDSDPQIVLNFDKLDSHGVIQEQTTTAPEKSKVSGYRLPGGPQQAHSLGVEYRAPEYWRVGTTLNYLTDNYPGISFVNRTSSFFLDPENGQSFPDTRPEQADKLLRQNSLDTMYFLNITGGKSWIFKNTYISFFVGINNVFDEVYRTGGYEQNRNGNYRQLRDDYSRGNPSFGPKYWYSYGRTFFMNLAVSF